MDSSGKLNGLDLFSGIGGISQALEPWVRTVAYCERDRAAVSILLSRMARGEIGRAPVWDDVTTLRGTFLPTIDIIFGGFPCQDLSLASLRRGLGGSRSGLFWEIVRLTRETTPAFVFLENVWPGVRKFIPTIRDAFEGIGYNVRDGHIAARDVGARHPRERWFLLAHPCGVQKDLRQAKKRKQNLLALGALENGTIADIDRAGREAGHRTSVRPQSRQPFGLDLLEGNNWDEYAAFLLRVDNGLPYRGNRIGALGNSVVPLQAREAFCRLMGLTTPEASGN